MDRVIDIQPFMTRNKVFDQETIFKIENLKKIKMMFLLIEITPSGATTYAAPTSPFLCENTILESNGSAMCRTTGTYTLGRLEKQDLTLYNSMVSGMTLRTPFNSTQTIVYPLFYWVYDNGQLFDTYKYGSLTLRNYTRTNKEEMGFNLDPTNIRMTLRVHYIINDMPYELDFSKAYNCFSYYKTDVLNVVAGENVFNHYLELQSKVRNLIFMIRQKNNAAIRKTINKIILTYPNGIRNEISDSTNYFLQSTIGNNRSDTFYIQLNKEYLMNEQRAPVKAEIHYESNNTEDSYLFIAYEYDTTYTSYENFGKTFMIEDSPYSI